MTNTKDSSRGETRMASIQHRRGARICIQGLREMERRANTADDKTAQEFNARIIAETKRLSQSVGQMSPEVEGAFLAMAEYILGIFEGIGYDIHGFTPLVSMTESGLAKETFALQHSWLN